MATPSPLPNASATARGAVSSQAQDLGGLKRFVDGASVVFGDRATATTRQLRPTVNVADFGAVGDGVTDCYPAFRAAIDSFAAAGISAGGRIKVGRGVFRLSQTLEVNKAIHLVGEGGGFNQPNTFLKFDGSRNGIWVVSVGQTADGGSGIFSIFENFAILSADSRSSGSGFFLNATATIRNVSVYDWSEHGIHLLGTPPIIADLSVFENVIVSSCGGNGVHIEGADANACLIIRVSCISCGWGFYDNSFLGNTYLACHTDHNRLGPYTCLGVNAASVYLGCYSEEGQGPSVIAAPAMVMGGLHGSAVTGGCWNFTNGELARYMGFYQYNAQGSEGDAVHGGKLYVGNRTDDGSYLTFQNTEDGTGYLLTFGYGNTPKTGSYLGCYAWNIGGSAYQNMLLIGGSKGAGANGRPLNGALVFPLGFMIGDGSQLGTVTKKVSLAAAVPVTGTHELMDEIQNTAPAIGQPRSWICLSAGTFGSYDEGLTAQGFGNPNHYIKLSAPSAVLIPGQYITCNGNPGKILMMQPWQQVTSFAVGRVVSRGGNVYVCTQSGFTGTVGPSGTGSGIADGEALWDYLGPVSTVLAISTPMAPASGLVIAFGPAPTFGREGEIY